MKVRAGLDLPPNEGEAVGGAGGPSGGHHQRALHVSLIHPSHIDQAHADTLRKEGGWKREENGCTGKDI
jgi:hypothetical protein